MKIKCYTVVSPSHRNLLEKYLLPSFPNNSKIDLTIKFIPQLCESATFYKDGWHDTMKMKSRCFVEGLESLKDDEIFMFIDNDIYLFEDFYEDIINGLVDNDVIFQNDIGGGCNTGFFAAKKNDVTRNLFKAVDVYIDKFDSEQVAMTEYCLNHYQYFELKNLKFKFLDTDKYWTYGVFKKVWNGDDDFDIPANIKMVHGNWCLFSHKEKLLDKVIDKKK